MSKRREHADRIVTAIVMSSLVISIGYAIFHIATAPGESVNFEKVKGDYTLMLFQSIFGVIMMFFPSFLKKRWRITMPNLMHLIYVLFLYGAIYLGEVRNFYYTVPHWDTILHTFSGGMLGAAGFSVVDILNRDEKISMHLSPLFVAVFAFCFAISLGTLWEIYEFTGDSLLRMNMQKFMLEDGTKLAGQAALADTMKDLIVDACGAIIMTVIGYFSIRKNQHPFKVIEFDMEIAEPSEDKKKGEKIAF